MENEMSSDNVKVSMAWVKEALEQQQLDFEDDTRNYKGMTAAKSKTGGWMAVTLILGTELCERLATLGIGLNLITYLVKEMHISSSQAPNVVTNFLGTAYLCCLIGGFVADTFLGRFWTIISFSTVQLMGMVLLTLSATLPGLRPDKCISDDYKICEPAKGTELAALYAALYLTALGTGGIKACVSAFGADQFDENDPHERCKMAHFFNWFVVAISIGALLSVTVLVYIQDNVGRGWGYGISAGSMLLAILAFSAGTSLYRYKAAKGSFFISIARVLVAAIRKRRLDVPQDCNQLFENGSMLPGRKISHTNNFRFLDKAAVVEANETQAQATPWRLCSVTQVEQVKMVIRILPICGTSVLVYTVFAQMTTLAIEQGSTMERTIGKHFLFPPGSLGVFIQASVIVTTAMYDQILLPIVRSVRKNDMGITMLQRIGCGMVFSSLAMMTAALVERKRLMVAEEHGLLDRPKVTIPISIFWLVPQYVLVGISEVFTYIGQLEFFYKQSPKEMRSMSTGLFMSTISVGFFMSSFLVSSINRLTSSDGKPGWISNNINRGRLDNFYWLLAFLSVCNLMIHCVCAKWYRYH